VIAARPEPPVVNGLAPAIAALTTVARECGDRAHQRALIELAVACDDVQRGEPRAPETVWIGEQARLLATAATRDGDRIVAAVAEYVAAAVAGYGGAAGPPEAPSSDRTGTDAMVLVIDDDPVAHTLIARRLRAEGYRVVVAEDGGEGVRRARQERPALVICDLHMPLAPGELVILSLRADPATAGIPILVVSADPSRLGPEHRVDAALTKPVPAAALLAAVRRLIGAAAPD